MEEHFPETPLKMDILILRYEQLKSCNNNKNMPFVWLYCKINVSFLWLILILLDHIISDERTIMKLNLLWCGISCVVSLWQSVTENRREIIYLLAQLFIIISTYTYLQTRHNYMNGQTIQLWLLKNLLVINCHI